MGARGLIGAVLLSACGQPATPVKPSPGASTPEKVAADFEAAVKASKDAYVGLFDFVAVGEMEILLHRYDLNGRDVGLTDKQTEQYSKEDGTPYPEARERRNVGNFYPILAQRSVGTGGCAGGAPV